MTLTNYPPIGGGADPAADVNITGTWTANDPIVPQGLATKNYIDNLPLNPNASVTEWSSTINYSVGNVVSYQGVLWTCKSSNINSAPFLNSNNWRQLDNIDLPRNIQVTTSVSAATFSFTRFPNCAQFDTTTTNCVVTMPSISSISDSDTNGRIQWFRFIKKSKVNKVTITLSGSDTFTDGTNTWDLVAQGVYSIYAIFQSTTWAKG